MKALIFLLLITSACSAPYHTIQTAELRANQQAERKNMISDVEKYAIISAVCGITMFAIMRTPPFIEQQ